MVQFLKEYVHLCTEQTLLSKATYKKEQKHNM